MSPLEAVIFDLDDTLFDHRGAASSGVREWLADLGVSPTEALVRLWFEAEERHVAAWHRGEVSFWGQRRARLREILLQIGRDDARDDRTLDQLFGDFVTRYEAAWRRFDDVIGALEMVAAAGLRVAVLTNGAELQQHRKLVAVGLAGLVGPMFCCDAIGFAKPDPRAYRHACERLGVARERALHVGDRYDLDVVAARAAGLAAVHLDRNRRGSHLEPSRVVSLANLEPLLHWPVV